MPCITAKCNGVAPSALLFDALTLMPRAASSSFTNCSSPKLAATCSGVLPLSAGRFTSTMLRLITCTQQQKHRPSAKQLHIPYYCRIQGLPRTFKDFSRTVSKTFQGPSYDNHAHSERYSTSSKRLVYMQSFLHCNRIITRTLTE